MRLLFVSLISLILFALGCDCGGPTMMSECMTDTECAADQICRTATLPAQICNRGTLPLAAGTEIAFRLGAPDGAELCRAPVPVALTVGMCTEVTCTGVLPSEMEDLFVVVDPNEREEECWEGNNVSILRDVRCQIVE